MLMQPSARAKDLRQRIIAFMEEHIYPAEPIYHRQIEEAPSRWGASSLQAATSMLWCTPRLWACFPT